MPRGDGTGLRGQGPGTAIWGWVEAAVETRWEAAASAWVENASASIALTEQIIKEVRPALK
jgi:hypothetical protein